MNRIFLALDNMSKEEVLSFLDLHAKNLSLIKIGMELFYRYGPTLITELKSRYNLKIFLDLKLHDIPNTVASAIKSLSPLEIDFLTIHLSGSTTMLQAARKACDEYLPSTKLIGVSVLTSMDERECQSIYNQNLELTFKNLFKQATLSHLDGIVCSTQELKYISKDDKILTICPGIRFQQDQVNDQKRVSTPEEAFQRGADYLVMGRALRDNPERITSLNN
ncbi:orotidine-5'-phosphate decarboxylase [Bacteriovorax sp. Seq25_V]|uniref:orotidine-5'-phosphate decarboxylase n=1 Tax=Bacteriovorax sp. Seq25_V TaxID=1201288 RepID=UPI00038A21BD|nr:orotidine-5'-phosphate decarboxylase [Bacteriovorax sp. Seq25_V]EQC46313.1 orotidine 5'-phosphate decarboxylase [Bacteriovorax sp. Seq25_V]